MKFKTKDEFEDWLRDYREPFGNKKNFLNDAILSKDYIVWPEKEFIMDEDTIYVINRTEHDSEYYYICYYIGGGVNSMWWLTVKNLYNYKNINIENFQYYDLIGMWPSMAGAKIWILTDELLFERFINWTGNPMEGKS